MVAREKLYTVEEFWEIASLPENEDRLLEWEDGVIIDMGSSRRINTVTAARIIYFLNAFVLPRNLGLLTGPDAGYELHYVKRVRRPDAAFLSIKYGIELVGVEFNIAPDLAVEVVSPHEDVFKKAREYLQSGTRIVWAVYADEKMVYVFHLDADGSLRSVPFGMEDTLDGGDVLPGFALAVSDVFPGQLT